MAARNNSGAPEDTAESPEGVIDTIGLGFALLNRRPYLIWVPVLLDLMIWLGGRAIAVSPLTVFADGIDTGRGLFERTGDVELMNAMSAVVPTFLSHPSVDTDAVGVGDQFWTFTGVAGLGLSIASLVVAILAGALHLTIVGRLVSDRPAATGTLAGDCLAIGVRAVGLIVVALAILLFMMLPVGLVAGGLWVFGVDTATLIVLAAITLGGWLGLFFVFALPAFAIGYDRIFPALRSSFRVVQEHTLAVIGLLTVALVIHTGMPYALAVFTESNWSVPFAIIVHAYVATGLLAAIILFFRHRDPGGYPICIETAPATSS